MRKNRWARRWISARERLSARPVSIYAGSYEDAKDSDIVILTSGVARKPGQTRLDLAQTNVNITKTIIPQLVKYAPDAIYIVVGQPGGYPDLCSSARSPGLPEHHIIGSGTILDTARLRSRLGGILLTSTSRTSTPMCSANTATPPSFPGPWPIFPTSRSPSTVQCLERG